MTRCLIIFDCWNITVSTICIWKYAMWTHQDNLLETTFTWGEIFIARVVVSKRFLILFFKNIIYFLKQLTRRMLNILFLIQKYYSITLFSFLLLLIKTQSLLHHHYLSLSKNILKFLKDFSHNNFKIWDNKYGPDSLNLWNLKFIFPSNENIFFQSEFWSL